jgi:trigger factor
MKVDVTHEGYQRKLAITVPATDVRDELDQAFRKLSRQVRLRGFRPGKAPRRVLEARFGTQVREDVAQSLIQASYSAAIAEQGLEPVGRPDLSAFVEVTAKNDFTFTITVDVKPDIALETYTNVDVVYPKWEIGQDEIDAAVSRRLESEARLAEVTDRAVQAGDMALIELTASSGDEQVVHEPGTMIRTEEDPYYTGIESMLAGLNVGDEKTASVTFAETARIEEVAGRELDVQVKVIGIQATEVPELTDELATELGYEGGISGLQAALKEQLGKGREELARNQARANMLEKLIEINQFDVPEGMIDTSLNMLVEELKMQRAYQTGQDPRNMQIPESQMADLRNRAAFASKAGLILDFVNKTEGISVSDADIEEKYSLLADQRGQTVEAVKGYFEKDGAVDELRDRILEEKTLEWLLERSNLVDAPSVTEAAPEAPKKVKAKKAAPTKPAAADDGDLSILSLSVGKLKAALDTGDHDGHLDALEAAETAGKARKGALAAIAARR